MLILYYRNSNLNFELQQQSSAAMTWNEFNKQ